MDNRNEMSNIENMDTNEQSKGVIIFNRDIRTIPCFKNSMLFGIYSGLAVGLSTFMLSSRANLSANMALGSYMGVALVYWCYCRYNYVQQKYAIREMQQMMRRSSGFHREDESNEDLQKQKGKLVDA